MRAAAIRYAATALLCLATGCANSTTGGDGGGGPGDLTPGGAPDFAPAPPDLSVPFDMTPAGLDVQPSALQTITVSAGSTAPTVAYTATLDGQPVSVAWSLDRGDIGSVGGGPASATTFAPKGYTGGLVTVVAGFNGATVERQVLVKITAQQNGPYPSNPAEQKQIPATIGDLTAGGGVGGVGGEGLGPAVASTTLSNALMTPTSGAGQNLAFIYPYDKTVWPRGLPAPLLMWSWTTNDADAIQISLSTTSGSFSWTGTFARPAILTQTGGAFIRHPIPQDVWDMATNSAGAAMAGGGTDKLTVSLVVAKGSTAYGPISETWTIAPARLSGIIYYNSYGTQLAQNLTGAVGGNGSFGGAVLSIHVGDTGPKLTAGTSGNASNCRVCHSVAANGSRLTVQHGDNNYAQASAYDLTPTGNTETVLATAATYPGLYPDGSFALSPSGQILPLPNDSALPTVTGLSAVSSSLGTPAFSPNGALVAFNPMSGPGVTTPAQQLLVMSFNVLNNTFSGKVLVADYTGKPAETRPGWPAFFPDGKSVVFHQQSAAGFDGNGDGAMHTRKGAKAQIAWTNVTDATHVTMLDALNGKDPSGNVYLPKLPAPINLACTGDTSTVGNINPDHGDDVDLNYEPTVNPVASGGYAWVVFTSRRMYGNEATIPPFCSDPRGVDLIKNITTKKLWVAAMDVSGAPGADASHPAFYLPAQELLAGNSRGFWVLDPCKPDGSDCATGDQCCDGYCEPNGPGGALVCSNMPPNNQCSKVQEKCAVNADCCDMTNLCINGFCASMTIP